MRKKFDIEGMTDEQIINSCVEDWFKPMAEELFKNEKVKSVVIACAQYWNDEADDACHITIMPISTEYTTWESCFKNTFKEDDGDDYENYFSKYHQMVRQAQKNVFGSEYGGPYPDNNEDFIRAISPYCKEDCSQDMDTYTGYTPFIVISKDDKGLRVRKIGDVIRLLK